MIARPENEFYVLNQVEFTPFPRDQAYIQVRNHGLVILRIF